MTAYAVTADRAEPVATIAASSIDAVIAAIESGAQRVESHAERYHRLNDARAMRLQIEADARAQRLGERL